MKDDQAEKLRAAAYAGIAESFPGKNRSEVGSCRVIAVASGKGGVGKTSLVLNLGLSLIHLGYRVTVIDADLGMANIDVMLNALPQYSLADVAAGDKNLCDIMICGPLDIKIIPGSSGLFEMANIDSVKRQRLLDQFSALEKENDFIIIDTAAGISRNVISFIGAADGFILVTTPEPTALTDAYGLLKVLSERGLKRKSHVIVNSTRSLRQGDKTFSGLNRVVQKYLPAMKLVYLGDIGHDQAVSSAVHSFIPFVLHKPHSAAAIAVKRIAWRLAANGGIAVVNKPGPGGLISRLREMI